MGYNLKNNLQLVFESSNWWFQRILEMAKLAGWIPLGTTMAKEINWNKNDYESHSGQFVTPDDSKHLYFALYHLIETHKSLDGKPIGIQKDEIDMIKSFLLFIKPTGVKNVCGFFIR